MKYESPDVSLVAIIISWLPLSDESGALLSHEVSYILCGTTTTYNSTENMVELMGLDPGTRVRFSVRAFSVCGEAGPANSLFVSTNDIHKC